MPSTLPQGNIGSVDSYHLAFNKNNSTGITGGAGFVHLSITHEFLFSF
jgi:hypothetical protein